MQKVLRDTESVFKNTTFFVDGVINKNHLASYINHIIKNIIKFSSNSEKLFLNVGNKLRAYHANSRELTNSVSKISIKVSDEIFRKGTDELNGQLKIIGSFLSNSSNEIRTEKQIVQHSLDKLFSLRDELEGYERIVKKFRMLGISTKIESARLGMEDDGFVSLADNVDKLGEVINQKISEINKKSIFLEGELQKTFKELERFGNEYEEQTEIIINKSAESIEEFKQKQNLSSKNAELISERSVSVSKNIYEIVTSIQFHDITRQQMEHICQSMSELSGHINNNKIDEEELLDFGQIHDVSELQARQLANSLDEFSAAVKNIVKNLKSVAINIDEIFTKSLKNLFDKDDAQASSLAEIENDLNTIIDGLVKNIGISDNLEHSIKDILNIVDDLSRYVSEIEEVGDEIEIIALNSRIKAARFGKSGAALGVLSESIQNLSGQAKMQTSATSKILFELGSESNKLGISLNSSEVADERKMIRNSLDKIKGLLDSMKVTEKEGIQLIKEMQNNVFELEDEILNTCEGIDNYEDAKKYLSPLIETLMFVADEIREKTVFSSDRLNNTKALSGKYTMKAERKIHNSFTKNNGINENAVGYNNLNDTLNDNNIELF